MRRGINELMLYIEKYCRLLGIELNNCYKLSVENLIDKRLVFDCNYKRR